MSDLFNRDVSNLGGVFAADGASLTFANGVLNTLAQQVQFQYSQTVTKLYEVGSNNIYYIGGRTQGQASMTRVVGPRNSVCAIYRTYGDVCNASRNVVTLYLQTGCNLDAQSGVQGTNGGIPASYSMSFCVITQVGISVAAQDMIINDSTQMMFGSLTCTG